MVRSAAAILALLILPSFAQGQEPAGTHTVVDDDTLWDLAQRYYEDPFQWRVIFEANQDSISDEDLIYPTEVFIIPGLPGTPTPTTLTIGPGGTTVALPEVEPEDIDPVGSADLVQFGFRQARPAEQVRSVFYQDTTAESMLFSGDPRGNRPSLSRGTLSIQRPGSSRSRWSRSTPAFSRASRERASAKLRFARSTASA